MNRILFYYDNYSGETARGGTEKATLRIANALKATRRWEIFHAYAHNGPKGKETTFKESLKLRKNTGSFEKELADFIRENRIDVVVNMGRFFRHNKLKKAIERSGRESKLLFMHHFAPRSEMKKGTYKSGWHLLQLNPANPLYWLRATLYPLLKMPRMLKYKSAYRNVYETSDKVILLSDGYKKEYANFAGTGDMSKFISIPNIYDAPQTNRSIRKEKRVLILSRMDEIQKCISLALEIWKKIEDDEALKEWELDIVGTGHDINAIKRTARRLRLKRATFHGWQDSKPFLEKGAILMTTSDYEGLPLAMIEAQTYGCVPIAFNSYASLKDIVEDGQTGVIVNESGDIDAFASKLSKLMKEDDRRGKIAANARLNAERFSSRIVGNLWEEMLNDILAPTP